MLAHNLYNFMNQNKFIQEKQDEIKISLQDLERELKEDSVFESLVVKYLDLLISSQPIVYSGGVKIDNQVTTSDFKSLRNPKLENSLVDLILKQFGFEKEEVKERVQENKDEDSLIPEFLWDVDNPIVVQRIFSNQR